MSYTTIFFLKKDRVLSADFQNAWLSAMYVWTDFAKRHCGMSGFPHLDQEDQMAVWNVGNRNPEKVPRYEQIVMLSTMDGALFEADHWPELVAAFEKYGKDHPNSSIAEQGKCIKEFMQSDEGKDVLGIAWRQTSVCGDTMWAIDDEESDDYIPYDPEASDDHFWAFDQLNDSHPVGESNNAN